MAKEKRVIVLAATEKNVWIAGLLTALTANQYQLRLRSLSAVVCHQGCLPIAKHHQIIRPRECHVVYCLGNANLSTVACHSCRSWSAGLGARGYHQPICRVVAMLMSS